MSWILLLIQLIPAVLKIIEFIRDLIAHLPHNERPLARREMRQLARKHVRQLSLAHAEAARSNEKGRRLAADAVEGEVIRSWENFAKRLETATKAPPAAK